MITKQDLQEAIAECQGARSPNANTCLKLASYYTILDHIESKEEAVPTPQTFAYSYETRYSSETEFGRMLQEKPEAEVLQVVDELMETVRVMEPRLYKAFMRKLAAI